MQPFDDRADVRVVEIAPQDRRDHAWDGEGHEERQTEKGFEAHHRRIEQQREYQRQAEHHGHLHDAVEHHTSQSSPKRAVRKHVVEVVEAVEGDRGRAAKPKPATL